MKKYLKTVVALFLTLFGIALVYVVYYSAKNSIPTKSVDVIIILGAKVHSNNRPSAALYNRSMAGAELYRRGLAEYVITTGGVGLGKTAESQVAAQILYASGVPRAKVIIEKESHNTFENLQNSKKLGRDLKLNSAIIVSDSFHVGRGVLFAKLNGFDPVYYSFPDPKYYPRPELYWHYMREASAMLYYAPKFAISGILHRLKTKFSADKTSSAFNEFMGAKFILSFQLQLHKL